MKVLGLVLGVAPAMVAMLATPALAGQRDPGYYANLGTGYVGAEGFEAADWAGAMGEADYAASGRFEFVGSFGYLYEGGLRTEFEVSYRLNRLDDAPAGHATHAAERDAGDLSAIAGMFNLLYEFDGSRHVLPYLGWGLGVAGVSLDADRSEAAGRDAALAFQGLAGVRLPLSEELVLSGGYRFFATSSAAVGPNGGDYHAQNIELGLALKF